MHRQILLVYAVAALVVMTFAAYWPVTRCDYIWDDDAYVTQNEELRSAAGLARIWFDLGATPQYYPLVYSTYWLEYRLWKLKPAGFHVVNILLHALSAVLLWRVLNRLELPGAWVAAAIFALHPMQVESVAWITERKNILSGTLYLAAALLYLRTVMDRPSRWLYAASLALFLGALLSKTVTASLPAALLLVLWWKRGRLDRRDMLSTAPFFVLGIALGLVTVWMEVHRVGASGAEWDLSFIERCLIAGRALWFYALKLVWPWPLMFVYPRWHVDATAWWQYLFPLAAAAVVVCLWLARQRVGRGPLVAVLYFAGTLVPALGFFNVYPMRYSFVADHFQYLACIGLISLIVGAALTAARRYRGRGMAIAAAAFGAVLIALGTVTWSHGSVFQNEETLWRDTLAKNDNAWIAHNNLGNLLRARGEFDAALHFFQRAVEINPNHAGALNNIGGILGIQGRTIEAIPYFRRAIALDPTLARAHLNLGNALLAAGETEEAAACYEEAKRLNPSLAEIIEKRLRAYESQRQKQTPAGAAP